MRIGLIVEGHGDQAAMPIVLRRLAERLGAAEPLQVAPVIRAPKSKLVREAELHRYVELAARKAGPHAPLLIVVDADADCPAALGPRLLACARAARNDRPLAIVIAKREAEAWYLAAAASLRGQRGLPDDLEPPDAPEDVNDAKGWLGRRMLTGYSETTDQPAFASCFDLESARTAPSFDKLWREVARLLGQAAAT